MKHEDYPDFAVVALEADLEAVFSKHPVSSGTQGTIVDRTETHLTLDVTLPNGEEDQVLATPEQVTVLWLPKRPGSKE